MSTKEIRFRVQFDPDDSTACVVRITCDDCDRFDPLCDGFVKSKTSELSKVSFISVKSCSKGMS